MKSFKEEFPKRHRPEINELDGFFKKEISTLFHKFADVLIDNYDLRFGIPVWTDKSGWVYRVGKSGVYLITGITIEENYFTVNNTMVKDKNSYELVIESINKLYENEKDQFLSEIEEKNKKQAENNKRRIQREKEELSLLQERINQEKYNKFRWPSKLEVNKLKQLYTEDSKGIQNEELADEIGICLYIRCKDGKEDMELMDQYAIRCHNCNAVITGKEDFRECTCGNQYSYKEYRRSYRRNNMPTGAAARVFDEYIKAWVWAKDYSSKMILIDKLLHEFHLSLISGTVHRPVAMNFIDGTREKIEKIINDLAYS